MLWSVNHSSHMFALPRNKMQSMPSRSTAARLQDIFENIRLARSFITGISFTDLQADVRTFYAIVRCLEIISEGSRRLPDDIKACHTEIEWSDVAGAGSIYRQHYHAVSDELIWQTVQEDLEPLRLVIEPDAKLAQ
jgi:uncharacterized protein with HEPN domain